MIFTDPLSNVFVFCNMKKTFLLIPSLLVLWLLAACTLSLDEYAVPEEKQGFDEPVTVELPVGTMEYQYNDGVLPVTRRIEEYITHADSTAVYFSSDIPSKWLPVKGSLLAAGCSRTLPEGLSHRVIAVERVGSEFRVSIEPATRQEVYKKFEINLDFDYVAPDLPVYDSLQIDSMGIDPEDLTITDFSLVDSVYGAPEDGSPRYVRTRSERMTDSVTLNRTFTFSFSKSEQSKIDFTIDFGIKHTLKQKVHYEESKDKNTKEQYSIDQSETELSIQGNIGGKKGKEIQQADSPYDPQEWDKLMEQLKEVGSADNLKKSPKIAKLALPIPGLPVVLVFEFNSDISVQGTFFGGAKIKYSHPQMKVGYTYDGNTDTEKEINEKIRDGEVTLEEIYIGGKLSASLGLRVGAGTELPGLGIGATVGLGFTAGIEFNAQKRLVRGYTIVDEESTYIKFYSDFTADFRVYFAPLGLTLAGVTMPILNRRLFEKTIYFTPRINTTLTKGTFSVKTAYDPLYNEDMPMLHYNVDFNFERLYTFNNYWSKMVTSPRLRVYYGDGFDFDYDDLKTKGGKLVSGEQVVEADSTYKFVFNQADLSKRESVITCVPCLYDATDKITTEFRSHAKHFGLQKPKISYYKYKQLKGFSIQEQYDKLEKDEGKEAADEFFEDLKFAFPTVALYYKYYSFWFKFKFENAPFINEWGVDVEMVGSNDNTDIIYKKRVPVAENLNGSMRSGTKKLILEFVTYKASKVSGGDCYQVRLRPYSINMLGEETQHNWTPWRDIYHGVDNSDDADAETFSASL